MWQTVSSPRSNNHGRVNRTFSSRGEGTAIKDNVIIVEKVGCNKNGQKSIIFLLTYVIFTNCFTYTNLIKEKCILFILSPFSGLKQFTHLLNTPKIVLIQRVSNMLTSGHLTMIFSHLTAIVLSAWPLENASGPHTGLPQFPKLSGFSIVFQFWAKYAELS